MSVIYESLSGVSQLFFVNDETGIFLTSVEVYFSNKDDLLPITLQIRNVVSGIPGNVVIPFSEVTLEPSQIQVSTDASVPTKFTFASPVYLSGPQQQELRNNTSSFQQTQQYAITLLSNSSNYKFFIAEQGKESLNDGSIFSNTPGTVGNYFKSQNAATWIPSPLETLKYRLFRASFTNEGLVRFFNAPSSIETKTISVTGSNQFYPLSKRIIVGLGSTVTNTQIGLGVTVVQNSATATLIGLGASAVSAIVNSVGVGYTNGTFSNIDLTTETGFGQGAKATIGVTSSGISTVTITFGGFGYSVGDILNIGTIGQDVGFGGKVSISQVGSTNSLQLDEIQGQFNVGLSTLTFINLSGVSTSLGLGVSVSSIVEDQFYDGLHMKVTHINHGMHSAENYVKISEFRPLNTEVHSKLSANLSTSDTTITLDNASGFEIFEGLSVSPTNLGYAIIGKEVVSYSGTTATQLTGVVRTIDGTPTQPFLTGTYVYKYEFNGVSLRRINKVHNFADVDTTNHPIELDSYFIKIDPSTSGKDRSNDLFFKETVLGGQTGTHLTQNIQYEQLITRVKNIIPAKTNLSSKVRTFTATSINGNENSFVDSGFTDFQINQPVFFDNPKLVASSTNETQFALPSPGNRSLQFDFYMTTTDERVSPVIDREEVGTVLYSNRLNNPVQNFSTDDRVRSLDSDPHEAIYISKIVQLSIPANSIKVLLTGTQNDTNDIRVFYRIIRPEINSINYEPFPGYSNYQIGQDGIKRVIDASLSDGSADFDYIKQTADVLQDFEYSVDDLPDFTAFAIKIVMSGTNQARPPMLKTLRAIATKKPKI